MQFMAGGTNTTSRQQLRLWLITVHSTHTHTRLASSQLSNWNLICFGAAAALGSLNFFRSLARALLLVFRSLSV